MLSLSIPDQDIQENTRLFCLIRPVLWELGKL